MNTKQQNLLRSLLKKYKYKNASNMVRQAMGINFDNFLQKTEPLYIIPRIASCYADEGKKKELMGVVYKEWLKDVVEKRWIAPLNEYSDEHGERTVLSAVYYLIDNGLWEVYEGRLALDAHEDNYYDKLSDMPAAIAQVLELNPDLANGGASDGNAPDANAQGKVSTNGSPSASAQGGALKAFVEANGADGTSKPDWRKNPDYVLNADEAVSLMGASEELCMRLKQNIDRLANYIYTAADSDVLREKINKQQQELEAQKEQHQRELAEEQKLSDEWKAKYNDALTTNKKISDCISKQRDEIKALQAQYDELNRKYKKALDERDDADRELKACQKLLDDAASKEQLPKKKVIPYSVLDAVPLLGRGVMTGLVPVLERYNIMVDYNR